MIVHISGKISGLPPFEALENFTDAKNYIYNKYFGFGLKKIYNPLQIKPLFGIKKYWFFMATDLFTLIFKCNSIFLLDNWKQSRGAKIELFFALLTNKKILE